jgi:hypothetical protein
MTSTASDSQTATPLTTSSNLEHRGRVIHVEELAGGLLAVTVRCCGEKTTDSVLTIGELHRDNAEIDKDIADHVARVEKLHHATARAKDHVLRLKSK